MKSLDRVVSFASRIMAHIAALATVAVMVVILLDLLHRTVDGGSLVGAYEGVVLLLAVIVFLGLPYAELSGTAVRVTLLTDRFGDTAAHVVRLISLLFSVALTFWLTAASWQGFANVLASGEYMTGLVAFPVWPVRLAIALGATALTLVLVLKVVQHIRDLFQKTVPTGDDELLGLTQSEKDAVKGVQA